VLAVKGLFFPVFLALRFQRGKKEGLLRGPKGGNLRLTIEDPVGKLDLQTKKKKAKAEVRSRIFTFKLEGKGGRKGAHPLVSAAREERGSPMRIRLLGPEKTMLQRRGKKFFFSKAESGSGRGKLSPPVVRGEGNVASLHTK